MTLSIEQVGADCEVTIQDGVRLIKNCNALKLACTMFDKPFGEKYTPKEMYDFGFGLKE